MKGLTTMASQDKSGYIDAGPATGGSSRLGRERASNGGAAAAAPAAPTVTPAPSWLGKRVGRFKLLALLGQGAMGRVFRAEDTLLHRHVALKVLPKHVKSGSRTIAVERLIREARAAASIEHPHAVQIHEVNEANGIHYIAMELIEGGSLYDLVKATGPLDPQRACQLAAEAAEALQQAHELGIVHRDVKPSNLMLTRAGRCKVADFGLARVDDPSDLTTVLGESVGTPQFVAPEIMRGSPASARSDIYSLGATLWYLLTGRSPFRAKSVEELIRLHLESPLPDLNGIRGDLPDGLVRTIAASMAKNPSERPASAGQFAKMLRLHTIPVGGAGAGAGGRSSMAAPIVPSGPVGSSSNLSLPTGSSGLDALAALVHTGGSHTSRPGGPGAPPPESVAPGRRGLGGLSKQTAMLAGSGLAALVVLGLVIWLLTRPDDSSSVARADNQAAQRAAQPKPSSPTPAEGQASQSPAPEPAKTAGATGNGGAPAPAPSPGGAAPKPVVTPVTPPKAKPGEEVDLMLFIDPARDATRGNWRREGGDIISDESGPAILEINYPVPAEYDFRIEFTSQDCVQQLLYKPDVGRLGVAFNWCMGVGDVSGFESINGAHVFDEGAPGAVREPMQHGKRHTSLVKVRNNRVDAYLDGRLLVSWETDYSDLGRLAEWPTKGFRKLGLGTWNKPSRFHKVTVTDRTGG